MAAEAAWWVRHAPGLSRASSPVLPADFFRELLAGAERSLQAMFSRSYGRLYAQHAHLFQGLFVELRRHLQGSRPGLDEALGDFWARLLERMVPLLNPQYSFPEGYLECVGRQAEAVRAFGDSPRQLRVQVSLPTPTLGAQSGAGFPETRRPVQENGADLASPGRSKGLQSSAIHVFTSGAHPPPPQCLGHRWELTDPWPPEGKGTFA